MDILVWPKTEYLCNSLIYTYGFCHNNEKRQKKELMEKVPGDLQVQKQYRLVWKLRALAKDNFFQLLPN